VQSPSKKHPPTSFSFFIAFSGASQQVEFKNPKNLLEKVHVENVLQKSEKQSMSFSPYFFNCVFGCFFAWGVQKHQKDLSKRITKKPQKKNTTSPWNYAHPRGLPEGLFWGSSPVARSRP
jgi:hypothetical protein